MATKQSAVWGIDLGQCALKAIRLERVGGQVTATAFDYIEHAKILSQFGANPDELIREALAKFLSRNTVRGDRIAIAAPPQAGLVRFVKLPPVEDSKLTSIVRFEARQQIPFPLDEVVWDFQKLDAGRHRNGFALDQKVGLFALKRAFVNHALEPFASAAVDVHIIQMVPFALCNFLCYEVFDRGKEPEAAAETAEGEPARAGHHPCVAALDIGADSSNLVITDGDKIIWQRPIPLGGNHFTRALTRDLKLTFAKAEHVKRHAEQAPDLRLILAPLKPLLKDLVSEIQRSLSYFGSANGGAHPEALLLFGNGWRLPGLEIFLQEKLQLKVQRLERLEHLRGPGVTDAPPFSENLGSFAVAVGLALQGLGAARIRTNLLPPEIRRDQLVRSKKPWAVASVAALLLALTGLLVGQAAEHRALTDAAVKTADDKAAATLRHAKELSDRCAALAAEASQSRGARADITLGAEQRFNWYLAYKYLHGALPQPDGTGLARRTRRNATPRADYDTADARKAYQLLLRKERGGPQAPGGADLGPGTEDFIRRKLIRINIAGLSALYSDKLQNTFFKKLAEAVKDTSLPGLTDAERQRLTNRDEAARLPKSGWVFEVRGSTDHERGVAFVVNTLVENLANPTAPGRKQRLSPEVKERIKDRISFVCLYAVARETRARPGPLVENSLLRRLLRGGDEPAAKDAKSAKAGPRTPDREGWRPVGRVAREALGIGAGADEPNVPAGGPPTTSAAGKDAPETGRPPRTEFVVLFLWQEPAGGAAGRATAADDADDDEP